MFDTVKDVLTKDIEVKGIKDFLEMEIEIKKLKEMLATEVKLKEFLLQEVDLKDFLPNHPQETSLKQDKTSESVAEKTAIPEQKLPAYDFSLIEVLHNDHKELLFIYHELMKNAKEKKYSMVAKHLDRFTGQITEHYALADKELYTYLKTYIHIKYPKRTKAFNELSLEMKNISLSIFFSISQSQNIPLRDETYDGFMKEFNQLGTLLRTRINREKQVLFKMYEESHEAKDICTSI